MKGLTDGWTLFYRTLPAEARGLIKKIERNLLELEASLSKLKKYYHYDDIEYKGIRDAGNLFNLPIDEDYYNQIRTNNAFNNIIFNMKVKEIKTKFHQLKNILI